jgi:hypothetical protein
MDKQEYRAYLQRGETRLSTLHRVAGAFLGGAGLLTLLPVLFRDTFSTLFAELLFLKHPFWPTPGSIQRWLLMVPVICSLVLPLWALYLLMQDLVRFYFTGKSFEGQVTYPRFILSGILLSTESMADQRRIEKARIDSSVSELLVPKADRAKRRLLKEALQMGHNTSRLDGDRETAIRDFLFKYTDSTPRDLPAESANMEASLTRHNMLLRALVLRYAKAFLLTVLTTTVTITALVFLDAATPNRQQQLSGDISHSIVPGYLLWLGVLAVYAVWCLLAALVVRRPIVWIYKDLNDDSKWFRSPLSLALFEAATLGCAVTASIATTVAIIWYTASSGRASELWAVGAFSAALTIYIAVYAVKTELDRRESPDPHAANIHGHCVK